MLLPADLHRAPEAPGGGGERGVGVALGPDPGALLEDRAGGDGVVDGEDRRLGGDGRLAEARGLARGEVAGGDHQEQGLAQVVHGAVAQERLVVGRGRDVDGPGQVRRRERQDHPRRRPDGGEVEARERPPRHVRQPEGEVEAARRRRDVVHVAGRARDVEEGGIVRLAQAHAHAGTSATRQRLAGEVGRVAAQQAPRRLHPVGGRGAHVREGGEVPRQCRDRRLDRLGAPGPARQGGLDRERALRRAGHPAVGHAGLRHPSVLEAHGEGAADGRDVLVHPLGHLVDAELRRPLRGR